MEEKKSVFRMVEFPSQGATLRGRFYLPPNASKPLPVVVMTHGFLATINGMVADKYAEVFYEAGFAVLLYDHRNIGISRGEPRQQINKWVRLAVIATPSTLRPPCQRWDNVGELGNLRRASQRNWLK
jgi:alpha-beta hydrolase superfamily lysophospholipase